MAMVKAVENVFTTNEQQILATLAANYLFLGEFEPLRSTLHTLAGKHRDAAAAILRAVISSGGCIPGVLFSDSVPSPSHLVWMCVLELEKLEPVDNMELVKTLAEMLLLLDELESGIAAQGEKGGKVLEIQQVGDESTLLKGGSREEEQYWRVVETGFYQDVSGFYRSRLQEIMSSSGTGKRDFGVHIESFHDKLQAWVEFVTLAQPALVASICENITRQKRLMGKDEDEDDFGTLLQKRVQQVHLNFLKECVNQAAIQKAVEHVKYLNEDYGLPQDEYSEVICMLAERCLRVDEHDAKNVLASIYEGLLASKSTRLLTVLEDFQDKLQKEEEDESLPIPVPFWKLHQRLQQARQKQAPIGNDVICEFIGNMYHYSRVRSEHVLEKATRTAIAAVKDGQLQIAADVLVPFPRLRPLVAALGWDLLRGNTKERRKMLKFLWLDNYGRAPHAKHADETSSIEYLCEQLCYNLEVAYFVADVKSGIVRKFETPWIFRLKAEGNAVGPSDDFAANLVLERLAITCPVRVIFDVLPNISLRDAVNLVKAQPVVSSFGLLQRQQDLELLHMHYGIQAAASAMIVIAAATLEDADKQGKASLRYLKEFREHLEAIKTPARRLWMLSVMVFLLRLKGSDLQCDQMPTLHSEPSEGSNKDKDLQPILDFVHRVLGTIRTYLPFNLEAKGPKGAPKHRLDIAEGWRKAWEIRCAHIRQFLDDLEWRLMVLERLRLPSESRLTWKDALVVLHSKPAGLLIMCIQKAQFNLAKEAVKRYSLSPEEAALLQIAECLQASDASTSSLGDVMSHIMRLLPPLSNAVLCLDAATTYAPSAEMSKQLVDQGRGLLSNLPQETPKLGSVPLFKRILSRLLELLEKEHTIPLRDLFSGADLLSNSESTRQGTWQRALIMLSQIIEDAQQGKGQFLSGKLHNLVKAFGDEESDGFERKQRDLLLGLAHSASNEEDQTGKGPKPAERSGIEQRVKPVAYLSAFILYIATVGDIFDGADTTHDFNFFSLLYKQPPDLLRELVFEKSSIEGAAKVAEVMGADFVHQVISACVPPVFPPSLYGWGIFPKDSILPPPQRDHILDIEIVKFLATLSPVRAILACVYSDKEKKYDFAIEQAERFPALQRWIQMQANLQRLCESPIFPTKSKTSEEPRKSSRMSLKRRREPEEEDTELVVEAEAGKEKLRLPAETEQFRAPIRELENEFPYQEAVEGLIQEGKLVDALAFADRWLEGGAPDRLLQLLIERGEDTIPSSSNWQDSGGHHSPWNNSWQYCIRLRDKRLAATLALKYLRRWELDAAIDVLTMCCCHLPADDVLRDEVQRVRRNLQQYNQILREDVQFRNWQEVESLCQEDPEGLALRLAGKGAVTAALKIAESFQLSEDLRRELQGRQLVRLLTADPISGGGPAEALRFLGSLHHPEDALPVAMTAMEQLPNLQSKQLLVHYLLKRRIDILSEEERARMDRLAMGLKMLGTLPLPWQQRCSGLHEHPQLILETLLMWKQFQAASQLLGAFPSLRNDKLIITYASKAITPPPPVERYHYLSSKAAQTGSGSKLNLGNGTRERRPFSWTRDSRNKIPMKDAGRKRKSALPPSQKAAWEAMVGHQEERPIGLGPEGYEKLAPLTMAEEWVLTGDPTKDEAVRNSHRYESAPNFVLFKALLSLCSDPAAAAKSAVELCVTQIKSILSGEHLPHDADPEAVERAFHAAGTFVQGLLDARTKLHKIMGNAETSTEEQSEAPKEANLSKLLSEADIWLNRVELLHSLLGSGVTASVDDVSDEESAVRLRDRLIQEERYGMAVYTCTKCKIDVFSVWEAWGYALLRIEHYAQARLKFKKAFQLYKNDPSSIVQKIVDTMEAGPPADVSAARSLYIHMAKSVSSASDDSLSADSYLNVLYIPTFTRAERSKKVSEEATHLSQLGGDEAPPPWSNLDDTRFEECKYYLDEYARKGLLPFIFRHGRYIEACQLLFPVDTTPQASVSSVSGKDSFVTDYGSLDDLSDLCVGYGAISNLEHVISVRMAAEGTNLSQYTSTALTRICNYFETHRQFNHLYRFQVLKRDYVAAGLCCIQLFLNVSTQDQALRHLERAKAHFEEGLAARQQQIENIKAASKGSRGKSPSEKVTDEDLIKLSARVTIQMEVVRCFSDADGAPWKRSLFGNPNDNDTFKRRCEIAEALVEKNFDLAFQIIYDFGLPAVYIYAGVASALADRRRYNNLVELLRNIKGTVDDEDWDQIVGAAIAVYANKHRERPDRLIDMLSSSHRKVLACVICGRLKSAFQIASRSGSIADVQWVAQQARMTGALPVEDMCKQWLARMT